MHSGILGCLFTFLGKKIPTHPFLFSVWQLYGTCNHLTWYYYAFTSTLVSGEAVRGGNVSILSWPQE